MAIISHINVNNAENPIASNNMLYGVCSTAAATAAKTVTISDSKFTLQTGAVVTVKFTYGNSSNNSPTLNVDGTGAKAIYMSGIRQWQLKENGIYTFIYDGTNWNILNPFTIRGISDALGFNPADNAAVEAFAEQVNQTFEEFDGILNTVNTRTQKIAPYNYLNNSDFRNPVNLKGQTEYKGAVEGINEWSISSVAWMVSVEDGYIRVSDNPDSTSTATCMLRQYIDVKNLRGKTVTFAAKTNGIDVRLNINNVNDVMGSYSTEGDTWLIRARSYTIPEDTETFFVALQFRNPTTTNVMCEWVALYEGEYTEDTLPEYQPKGYNVELLNCEGITSAIEAKSTVQIIAWEADD